MKSNNIFKFISLLLITLFATVNVAIALDLDSGISLKDISSNSEFSINTQAEQTNSANKITLSLVIFLCFAASFSLFILYKLYFFDPIPKSINGIDQSLVGINGWMILAAISIFSAPVRLALNSYDTLLKFASNEAPLAQINHFLYLELFANIFFMFAAVFILLLFLRKRSSLPVLYMGFLVLYTLLIAMNYLQLQFMEKSQPEHLVFEMQVLILSVLLNIIWFFYFLFSRQVKATFHHRLNE